MSLEHADQIDAIGLDNTTGDVILTIADAWDWSDEQAHIVALKDKFDRYFTFVQSEQIRTYYPDAAQRRIIIDIISRFDVPERGKKLIAAIFAEALPAGIFVRHKIYKA